MNYDAHSRRRRLLRAFLWGLTITLLCCWPLFVSSLDFPDIVGSLLGLLLMPGAIVAIIFAGGNVHTPLRSVIVLANVVIYTGLFYALLGIRRRSTRVEHPPKQASK